MKLLNESCKFQCLAGNPSILITALETGNVSAKDSRKKILTNKARCQIKTPLPCVFLTSMAGGTPVNCNLSHFGWMNTSKKMKCNGNEVLTDSSFTKCIYGGVIKPVGSSCISKIRTVTKDIFLDAVLNPTIVAESPDVIAGSSVNVIGKQKGDVVKEGVKPDLEKECLVYASHTMCDYENCAKKSTCRYFNSQIYIENSSAKLSKNFQTKRKSEWEKYYSLHKSENEQSVNGGWRIAAHHIISGNQVLMMKGSNGELLYGVIVKLANYFGYDINNEWNCIMLPTNKSNFGGLEVIGKTANAYEVMCTMGRQWHVGGHEYQLSKETLNNLAKFYEKHPEQYISPGNPGFFSNYKTAMKEEMDKLLMKYSRIQCWEKNYEKKRQKFIDDMNGLSSKVEGYLLEFGNNPRKSFPFFVSKVSVEYAYNLPAVSKLVIIYQEGKKTRAKKIRIERYMKNALEIVPVEKDDIEITDDKTFIRFCENIMYFITDVRAGEYKLPFCHVPGLEPAIWNVDFQGKEVMEYLIDYRNEIMAFIKQHEYYYQPVNKIVSLRGGV